MHTFGTMTCRRLSFSFPDIFALLTDQLAGKYSLAAAKKELENSATKKEEDAEVRKNMLLWQLDSSFVICCHIKWLHVQGKIRRITLMFEF